MYPHLQSLMEEKESTSEPCAPDSEEEESFGANEWTDPWVKCVKGIRLFGFGPFPPILPIVSSKMELVFNLLLCGCTVLM